MQEEISLINKIESKMSSTMNNNLPVQSAPNSSSQSEFAQPRQSSSLSVNPAKPIQQSNCSRKDRSGRGRGRGSAAAKSEQTGSSESSENSNNNLSNRNSSNRRRGKQTGSKTGKYRQRQATDQLIDGINGLDIDLVESIAPSNSRPGVAEAGRSRHMTNSRKVNLTHLLNFNYERKYPRGGRYQSQSSEYGDHVGFSESYHRAGRSSEPPPARHQNRDSGYAHKFNKQQFLQANCQFVVSDGHDYTIHKVNPDWPVDWDCIEEVKFKQSASTETTCPLCLESPVAAKITRCGHIYCWTCMLHYLSLSDENCRQCPICFEAVYKTDLRSVVSHSFINHSVGEDIELTVMIRKKGCVEVEPYTRDVNQGSENEHDADKAGQDNQEHYRSQANLVIVDPRTVIDEIAQRERNELAIKMDSDKDEPEVCYIIQAMELLDKRIDRLQQMESSSHKAKDRRIHEEIDASKSYLFYQCSDGQHIYLNPFSTKILCHEYSSLENCPSVIHAKILQMDWVSMNETWRKRFKYLEHLPLTCEFRLIEIDFEKSNLISKETYNVFEDQIKARARERTRRLRAERKRDKIIQVEQDRRIYGIQPSLKINLDNIEQFPSVSDERFISTPKPKNQAQVEVDDSTSDEEVANDDQLPRPNDKYETQESESNVALSFKEIQMQEAAKEAKLSKSSDSKNVWANKTKNGNQAAPSSSSFAQLLVNAPISQKGWTSRVGSTSASAVHYPTLQEQLVASHSVPGQQQQQPRTRNSTIGSDDGGEELRAPPSEFTISDFIDMNVVSGKKKGKPKSGGKKA